MRAFETWAMFADGPWVWSRIRPRGVWAHRRAGGRHEVFKGSRAGRDRRAARLFVLGVKHG